jgi:hypothetical protein
MSASDSPPRSRRLIASRCWCGVSLAGPRETAAAVRAAEPCLVRCCSQLMWCLRIWWGWPSWLWERKPQNGPAGGRRNRYKRPMRSPPPKGAGHQVALMPARAMHGRGDRAGTPLGARGHRNVRRTVNRFITGGLPVRHSSPRPPARREQHRDDQIALRLWQILVEQASRLRQATPPGSGVGP